MIMTLIDDDNIRYYEAVVGDRYVKRTENELYAGVIDDDGEAVAAGIFVDTPDGLEVDFIAVADERRRQGIGSFLLCEIKDVCKESGVGSMHATLLAERDEAASDALYHFLEKNGFEIGELDARRSVYDLREVLSLPPFAEAPLKSQYLIKSVSELSEKEKEIICDMLDLKSIMTDPHRVVSFENRHGGFLFEEDKIRALIVAETFRGAVHLVSLYGDGEGLKMFPYLFDHVKEAVRRDETEYDMLIIDTAGDKMASFEDHFLENSGVRAIKQYHVYNAVLRL